MQHLGLKKKLHPITLEDGLRKLSVPSWIVDSNFDTFLHHESAVNMPQNRRE
jgi:hypothetical protein